MIGTIALSALGAALFADLEVRAQSKGSMPPRLWAYPVDETFDWYERWQGQPLREEKWWLSKGMLEVSDDALNILRPTFAALLPPHIEVADELVDGVITFEGAVTAEDRAMVAHAVTEVMGPDLFMEAEGIGFHYLPL